MPLGWIKLLPMVALLLSATVTITGCNTVAGTVGGVGRDISMIGDTLSSVTGDDCGRRGCGERRASRDCGRRGCRQLRSVTSSCARGGCGREYGRGYRAPRRERASYRRDRYCC